MSRHLCNKCGRSMDYPDDHSTTAGCLTPYPITVEYPFSMPDAEFRKLHHAERTEDARRLSRYDEAVRLIERLCANGQDLFEWHKALEDGQAFLAAEPKVGEGA